MSEKEGRRWRWRWWNKAAWHIHVHAERSEEICDAQQSHGRKLCLFLPARAAEKTGECDRRLRQAGEEVDFWLIQADSCEPPPKCSVQEILAFHRIHPSTHPPAVPLCPSTVCPPLPNTPGSVYLTTTPHPDPRGLTFTFPCSFEAFPWQRHKVCIHLGLRRRRKGKGKKEMFSQSEGCCVGSVWRYNHYFKWQRKE